MKILHLNINGLKAFYNRGEGEGSLLDTLIATQDPDIILFNETKCSSEDVNYWLSEWFYDWNIYASENTEKKGYAGVAAMIKNGLTGVKKVTTNINLDPNNPYSGGRIIQIDFPNYTMVGVYTLNSGDKSGAISSPFSGDDLRDNWDKLFIKYLSSLNNPIVIGDLNVCHKDIDCWNMDEYFDELPGCKSYEQDNFSKLLSELKLIDTFRELNPNEEQYSWFSYRGNSRYVNHGFRLDYALIPESMRSKLVSSTIIGSPTEYSDHSPIVLTLIE